jgi:putative tricarboxylic transport membrane protein
MLFVQHGEVVRGLYAGLLVANIAMLIIGYLIMGPCIWLVSRPKPYLMAFIYALVVSGVYAFQASLFNVGVVLAFGVVGYALRYFQVPFLPMVLGVVLGFMIESNYRRALVLSNGDLTTFVRNPISAALLATALVVLVAQLMRQTKSRAGAR